MTTPALPATSNPPVIPPNVPLPTGKAQIAPSDVTPSAGEGKNGPRTADELTGGAKAVVSPAPVGAAFRIGVADQQRKEIKPARDNPSDPNQKEARWLVFTPNISATGMGPTTTDMNSFRDLEEIAHALNELYPDTDTRNETKFRPYFVRLFQVAQLVLEGTSEGGKYGGRLSIEASAAEIKRIGTDLIDDEAPRIKNSRLRDLTLAAGKFSVLFLSAYVVLMLFLTTKESIVIAYLGRLMIDSSIVANFMLLFVGSFVGVCLSYTIRTHTFSLTDLTRSDSDYLSPKFRLLLAGTVGMLLALLAMVGLGDVQLGGVKISEAANNPMLAFLVGAIFGISEKKLSGTIEMRVGDLLGRIAAK